MKIPSSAKASALFSDAALDTRVRLVGLKTKKIFTDCYLIREQTKSRPMKSLT